jgi:hypothetical protein
MTNVVGQGSAFCGGGSMTEYIRNRAIAVALALGLGTLCGGPAPSASAHQPDIMPCHIQRGDRQVREEGSTAIGRTTFIACARAIWTGSGTGTWGPYEVEVEADGRVSVSGEDMGTLERSPGGAPSEGGGPGRG